MQQSQLADYYYFLDLEVLLCNNSIVPILSINNNIYSSLHIKILCLVVFLFAKTQDFHSNLFTQ